MKIENQERIGDGERQRPAECGGEGVQMAGVVHAVGYVVDVAAVPGLVVVRGAASALEECTVVRQNPLRRRAVWLVDEGQQGFDGQVIKRSVQVVHGDPSRHHCSTNAQ